MKKATQTLRVLLGLALGLAMTAVVWAQQPSPSPQPPKPADAKTQSSTTQNGNGEGTDPYTIRSSVELGYRGLSVDGNRNKYQSDLNYRTGPRVFDSSLLMEAKEGEGGFFDTLLVTTTGWGSDPYGNMRTSIEKSRWYRFDANYRWFKYFRYVNNFANPNYATRPTDPNTGQHGFDVRQKVGDFDLTILPKNENFRFNVGYSPERYDGPAFTTWHYGGDDFMFLSRMKSLSNDFRVGADWKLGPIDFSFLQGFRRYREDNTIDEQSVNLGVNPAATNFSLTGFNRTQPVRSKVNYSRLSAHTLIAKRLDLTGRIIYSKATTNFNWNEDATGANFNTRISGIPSTYNPPGTILNLGRWGFVGDSSRPNTLGDFGVTYLATDHLRISNTFRYETFHVSGGALYNGLFDLTRGATRLAPLTPTGRIYESTKYRRFQNTIEADYEFNERYAVRFGYRFGDRQIERSIVGNNFGNNGAPLLTPSFHEEGNQTHAFSGGIKARPTKSWMFSLDAERGTSDNIVTRVGNYDYTNIRARTRYAPTREMSFNVAFITRNNSNPSQISQDGTIVSLADFGVDVKTRVFTSAVNWAPSHRFSMSTGYNYHWQDNDAVIEYVFLNVRYPNGRSLNFIRNHFFFFDTVTQIHPRVSFYGAYRINKDNGQGDRPYAPTTGVLATSYPMSFQQPEARLAFKLSRRFDWNVGYQYYNYNESPLVSIRPQNYHAHMPYTSVRVYFGNTER